MSSNTCYNLTIGLSAAVVAFTTFLPEIASSRWFILLSSSCGFKWVKFFTTLWAKVLLFSLGTIVGIFATIGKDNYNTREGEKKEGRANAKAAEEKASFEKKRNNEFIAIIRGNEDVLRGNEEVIKGQNLIIDSAQKIIHLQDQLAEKSLALERLQTNFILDQTDPLLPLFLELRYVIKMSKQKFENIFRSDYEKIMLLQRQGLLLSDNNFRDFIRKNRFDIYFQQKEHLEYVNGSVQNVFWVTLDSNKLAKPRFSTFDLKEDSVTVEIQIDYYDLIPQNVRSNRLSHMMQLENWYVRIFPYDFADFQLLHKSLIIGAGAGFNRQKRLSLLKFTERKNDGYYQRIKKENFFREYDGP